MKRIDNNWRRTNIYRKELDFKRFKSAWLRPLLQILNDNWDQVLSLEELSLALNLHPVTISKQFAKQFGMTLSKYKRTIKTVQATNLLLTTNQSLADIAYSCGFSDQSHMSRVVKEYAGVTPGQLKKHLRLNRQL